jgi:hypothetical protein
MNVSEISKGCATQLWALRGQGHIVSLHQSQPVEKPFLRWLKNLGLQGKESRSKILDIWKACHVTAKIYYIDGQCFDTGERPEKPLELTSGIFYWSCHHPYIDICKYIMYSPLHTPYLTGGFSYESSLSV